ncbi:MAG: hypothetical protein K2O03_04525 [Lachnospiraceae bacterium]|nr:hypothetical protein [Lachnospiraceae bacterium]
MICSNEFYSTWNQRMPGGFMQETGKKEPASRKAELFALAKEEETVGKRGKQSVLDDARAAGKEKETSPETETQSQIIVKPDGSKVLVITVRCGASVKVKSLKISDPADSPNDENPQRISQEDFPEGDLQEDMSAEMLQAQI